MAIPNSFDILQAVLEATPDAIFVKDLDGRYVLVNEAAARFLGRTPEEIVGKHDLELYPEETARRFIHDDQQVLASGRPQEFEGLATGHSGTRAYLVTKGVYRDKEGRTLGLFGISHDITELRRTHETLEQTREALFQAQKMEAVGQLTGSLAHDFNNILGVILGNLDLLRLRLQNDTAARELIDVIQRAAAHGQDLVGNLLAFSRRRELTPRAVNLNVVADGMVRLLERTLGTRIEIRTALSERPAVALADPTQLDAALLNVILNARDAMPNGGTLTLGTSISEITRPPARPDDLRTGTYAVLSVIDSGCGMPPDVATRVFEPFFTTKGGGSGTGLGLSMVHGFARESGGAVAIESQEGHGTTVRIYLPATTASSLTP